MTVPRWQRVKDVFYDAALRAPAERAAFLDAACAGDDALRREIDSLLASYQEAGPFLSGAARLDGHPKGIVGSVASAPGQWPARAGRSVDPR